MFCIVLRDSSSYPGLETFPCSTPTLYNAWLWDFRWSARYHQKQKSADVSILKELSVRAQLTKNISLCASLNSICITVLQMGMRAWFLETEKTLPRWLFDCN